MSMEQEDLPRPSPLDISNYMGNSKFGQQEAAKSGLKALMANKDQAATSRAAIAAKFNTNQRNAVSTKLIGMSQSGNFGLLGPGVAGAKNNNLSALRKNLNEIVSDESLDKMRGYNVMPQPPSQRGAEQRAAPAYNPDEAINISHSNIKL